MVSLLAAGPFGGMKAGGAKGTITFGGQLGLFHALVLKSFPTLVPIQLGELGPAANWNFVNKLNKD